MKRRSEEKKSNVHVAIAGVFLAALWVSPLQGLFGFVDEDWKMEERRLASLPEDEGVVSLVVNHRTLLADYVRDHFGLRRTLIRWHHRAKLRLFGRSPVSKLIIGEDGWLFLGEKDPLDDLRPMTPLPGYLFESWEQRLHEVSRWADERGARLVIVIAPSKQSVYAEYLPERVRSFAESSRVDEMLSRLAEQDPLDVVNLRPVLRAAKRNHRTYYRTDTHWNDIGAHAAYVEIVNRIAEWFPRIRPKPLSDFRIARTNQPGGDLARMLAMTEVYREENLRLKTVSPRLARRVGIRRSRDETSRVRREISFEQENSDLPRAAMFHDSFGQLLIPFLAENFSRLDCRLVGHALGASWNLDEDAETIDTSQPDVVIWEIAERAFERR